MIDISPESWPPDKGGEFIRSETFAQLLVELSYQYTDRYPSMDFSDAVSQVFAWFDGKLAKNRRFINSRRFPTFGAFKSYLRQSLWNAAILAQRKRQRRGEIEALSIDPNALAKMDSQMELDILLDLVKDLPEPHKTVLERIFFDEGDPNNIACALDMSIDDLFRYYEEAIDMLVRQGAFRNA